MKWWLWAEVFGRCIDSATRRTYNFNRRGHSFGVLVAPRLARPTPDFLKIKFRRFPFAHLQPILRGQAPLIFQIKILCVISFACIRCSRPMTVHLCQPSEQTAELEAAVPDTDPSLNSN